jgi:hypothetical protein
MTRSRTLQRWGRPALAAAMMGLCLVSGRVAAEDKAVLTISGSPVTVEEESVKCQMKLPSWISTRRLADCDSATFIDVPKTGTRLVKFEIWPKTQQINQGVRAELRDMFEARNGEEVWYRFSTIIPPGYPFDVAPDAVVAQWHERMPEGVQHRRPPIAHRLFERTFRVTVWDDAAFAANPNGNGILAFEQSGIGEGVELEYVYRVVWKQDQAGRIVAWRRIKSCSVIEMACSSGQWAKLFERSGPIGFKDAESYYFKMGIYTTHPFRTPMFVYHRGYRRGPDARAVGATDKIFTVGSASLRERPAALAATPAPGSGQPAPSRM